MIIHVVIVDLFSDQEEKFFADLRDLRERKRIDIFGKVCFKNDLII